MKSLNSFTLNHEEKQFHRTMALGWKQQSAASQLLHFQRWRPCVLCPGSLRWWEGPGLCQRTVGRTREPFWSSPSPRRTRHGPQSPSEDRGGQGTMVPLCTFRFCIEASERLCHCRCIVPRNSGTFWQSQSLECFKWSSWFIFCLYFSQSCLIDSI